MLKPLSIPRKVSRNHVFSRVILARDIILLWAQQWPLIEVKRL